MIALIWSALPLADAARPPFVGLNIPGLTDVDRGLHQVIAGVAATLGLAAAGLWLAVRWGRLGRR